MRPAVACSLVVALLPAQRVAEGPEPNATPATATLLPVGREALGWIASAADSDWYALQLPTAGDLRLETGPGADPQIGDTVLTLLDAGGAPLRAADDGLLRGRYSQLTVAGLPAGSYLVAVERGSFAAPSGSYVLDVRLAAATPPPVPPTVAEAAENNDPRSGGAATAVVLPARCSGELTSTGSDGDWDFWRFTLAADAFVQVRVAATASHPNPPVADDPVLYLFDGASPPNRVAGPFHARDFGTFDAVVDQRLPAGSWQLAIRGVRGSPAGRYYLDVHRLDAARILVHPGGCNGRVLTVGTTDSGPNAPLAVERPVLGTTFTLQGQALGAFAPVGFLLGDTAVALDLAALGAPGCTLEVLWFDLPILLADAAGHAALVVPVPEDPALAGAAVEFQAMALDAGNALGLSFSNRVSAVAGH